ncbi:MAG: SHOCT domain-containing protein [Thermoleophilia bacterium]|nr:SHOCT domain-containing protein [Thermoleophilia bacterium]
MWDGGYGMGAAGVIWIVVMLAVLALIVVGIVLLVRSRSHQNDYGQVGYTQAPPPGGGMPSSALQILEERYARGDIDQEEFLKRRADLLGRP